ncbi:LPXTG cell wall anchor domain-containing protein [Enterococcus sp. DIV1271a]|nr:LPXTG cell wall anchor domain-containing protein [Enterococcus sp. DIV1271a]
MEKGQTEAVEVTKTNHLTPGGVVLTKTDDQSGEGLAGAVFELQDKEGKKLQSGLTTDASGKLSIDELAPGEYQLVETKAPTGYDLDKKPVSFTIEKGQTEAVEVTKTNTRKANSILLEKIDSQSGEKLANASFMIKDQKGKIVQKNLKTDSSGHLSIEGLPEGSYELIETKAPEGYILDDRPIAFNISKRNESVELTKENDPKKVNQKTDESFPKTGEQRQPLLVLFGVLILILFFGFLTYIVINKKKKR